MSQHSVWRGQLKPAPSLRMRAHEQRLHSASFLPASRTRLPSRGCTHHLPHEPSHVVCLASCSPSPCLPCPRRTRHALGRHVTCTTCHSGHAQPSTHKRLHMPAKSLTCQYQGTCGTQPCDRHHVRHARPVGVRTGSNPCCPLQYMPSAGASSPPTTRVRSASRPWPRHRERCRWCRDLAETQLARLRQGVPLCRPSSRAAAALLLPGRRQVTTALRSVASAALNDSSSTYGRADPEKDITLESTVALSASSAQMV